MTNKTNNKSFEICKCPELKELYDSHRRSLGLEKRCDWYIIESCSDGAASLDIGDRQFFEDYLKADAEFKASLVDYRNRRESLIGENKLKVEYHGKDEVIN